VGGLLLLLKLTGVETQREQPTLFKIQSLQVRENNAADSK
jgi:hypothetical protein